MTRNAKPTAAGRLTRATSALAALLREREISYLTAAAEIAKVAAKRKIRGGTIGHAQLGNIARGDSTPSPQVARAIEAWSGGRIKAAELLGL